MKDGEMRFKFQTAGTRESVGITGHNAWDTSFPAPCLCVNFWLDFNIFTWVHHMYLKKLKSNEKLTHKQDVDLSVEIDVFLTLLITGLLLELFIFKI